MIASLSVRQLANRIQEGKLSSRETTEHFLDRIESSELNAVVHWDAAAAMDRAREADEALCQGRLLGPLHGVPMTIKDSFDAAGLASTGGIADRAAHYPTTDATVAGRLRQAGAVLMGKTNTSEMTLSFDTNNQVYGPTRNPFDLGRSAGGSSGGAAAAVSAGLTPFDVGTDYGGSIRLPAHYCGVCGLKPTAGRVPRTGHVYPAGGILDMCQQVGPIARRTDDVALLTAIIAGADGKDPGTWPLPTLEGPVDTAALRVAFHTTNGIAQTTADTIQTVRNAAALLDAHVACMEEARPDCLEETLPLLQLYRWDGGAGVRRLMRALGSQPMRRPSHSLNAVELDALIARWFAFRSRMETFLDHYDVILCPVNEAPARTPDGDMYRDEAFTYTFTYNLTGWPAAAIRVGTSSEGLPIGVQVVAGKGREDRVFAVCRVLEAELGPFPEPEAH